MADFCHDWEPGGLGCHGHGYPEHPKKKGKVQCPPDCLGDFSWTARKFGKKLRDGEEILLGLCEGHNASLYLFRLGTQLYVEHVSLKGAEGYNRRKKWNPALTVKKSSSIANKFGNTSTRK